MQEFTILFDNDCFLCTKFAKGIDVLSRGKITLVGHYTDEAKIWHKRINDLDVLEMFWFIDKTTAYGGRAGIIPLMKCIILQKGNGKRQKFPNPSSCKNANAVFWRSASLIRNKKIKKLI